MKQLLEVLFSAVLFYGTATPLIYLISAGINKRKLKTESSLVGRARVGYFYASWPFAKLTIANDQLTLKVAGFTEVFPEDKIIKVKPICNIPVIGWGIQIEHTIDQYPKKIIFWAMHRPQTILNHIKERGFNEAKLGLS